MLHQLSSAMYIFLVALLKQRVAAKFNSHFQPKLQFHHCIPDLAD